jgi:hypothetical protein
MVGRSVVVLVFSMGEEETEEVVSKRCGEGDSGTTGIASG